jgi:hypothetical protein
MYPEGFELNEKSTDASFVRIELGVVLGVRRRSTGCEQQNNQQLYVNHQSAFPKVRIIFCLPSAENACFQVIVHPRKKEYADAN